MLKTILVIGVSSLTFFIVGFGFSIQAKGGVMGQDHFIGLNYDYEHYTLFVFYLALCVMMSTIATGSIAERTHTDTYLFFSFVTSGFIYPLGLAWVWNDGWLQNIGFKDYGGASIVHLMGGVAGFVGTYLIGPRIGYYKPDTKMAYVHDDKFLEDDEANSTLAAILIYRDKLINTDDSELSCGKNGFDTQKLFGDMYLTPTELLLFQETM